MTRIGILHGRERAFPQAVLERICALGHDVVAAEPALLGGVTLDAPRAYDVVLDRISHEFPYYRSALAKLASDGARIVPDPAAERAPDRFQTALLASRLGIPVPRRAVLPPREHPIDISSESLANLLFPLDWERVFATVGFPALLRPLVRRASEPTWIVRSPQELFDAHAHTGTALMVLESLLPADVRVRAVVVGHEIRVMRDDPSAPAGRYAGSLADVAPEVVAAVVRHAKSLATSLGHDVVALDFAASEGVAYLADAPSLRPLAEPELLGEGNFAWFVEQTARLLLRQAESLEGRDLLDTPEEPAHEEPAKASSAAAPLPSLAEVPVPTHAVAEIPALAESPRPPESKKKEKGGTKAKSERKEAARARAKLRKDEPRIKKAAPLVEPPEPEPLPIIELDEPAPPKKKASRAKKDKKSKKRD